LFSFSIRYFIFCLAETQRPSVRNSCLTRVKKLEAESPLMLPLGATELVLLKEKSYRGSLPRIILCACLFFSFYI